MARCGRKCEVYSRIVGYLRPVQNWNEGKVAEFHDRKTLDGGWRKIALKMSDYTEQRAPEESQITQIAAGG